MLISWWEIHIPISTARKQPNNFKVKFLNLLFLPVTTAQPLFPHPLRNGGVRQTLASENAAGGSAVMFAPSVCRLRVDASFHRNQPSSAEKKRLCAADALLLSVVLTPAAHAHARARTPTMFSRRQLVWLGWTYPSEGVKGWQGLVCRDSGVCSCRRGIWFHGKFNGKHSVKPVFFFFFFWHCGSQRLPCGATATLVRLEASPGPASGKGEFSHLPQEACGHPSNPHHQTWILWRKLIPPTSFPQILRKTNTCVLAAKGWRKADVDFPRSCSQSLATTSWCWGRILTAIKQRQILFAARNITTALAVIGAIGKFVKFKFDGNFWRELFLYKFWCCCFCFLAQAQICLALKVWLANSFHSKGIEPQGNGAILIYSCRHISLSKETSLWKNMQNPTGSAHFREVSTAGPSSNLFSGQRLATCPCQA